MPEYSPYEILEVPIDANFATIKKQYKRLIRKFTPEHHPKQFMKIRAAYERISHSNFEPLTSFPIYKTPWNIISKSSDQIEPSIYKEALSEIFESPYNTNFELKKLLTPKK